MFLNKQFTYEHVLAIKKPLRVTEKIEAITKAVKVAENQNSFYEFATQGILNTVVRFSGKMF